jgi:dephospho-CoA kinase
MLTVGLTGSSGSGKGYVSDIMKSVGIPCLDTDKVCRDVYMRGNECYDDLVRNFGEGILGDDGEIDRKKLFNLTFTDKDKYEQLNSIAFYHIMRQTKKWLDERESEGEKIVVIDAPMLYESGFDKMCDITICVTAPTELKLQRIVNRDGIPYEKALARINNQLHDDELKTKCNYEIKNSLNDNVEEQILAILSKIEKL